MSEKCDLIDIFPIYGQFSTKLILSLVVIFYLTQTENRTKKSPTQLSHYWFE